MPAFHSDRARHAVVRFVCGVTCSALLAVLGAASPALVRLSAQSHAAAPAALPPYAAKLSQPKYKMVVDKDVKIPTRGGSYVIADVFRPDAPGEKFPPLLSLSVYQKELQYVPHAGPFSHQERPEPDYWVSRGYVLVFVDSRGTGRSPGNADVWSMAESRDYYDAIEWAAAQSWSTGKVGLAGVSYYAVTQWNVASLKPPHLAAILPWEGFTDHYRDWAYPGGLFGQTRVMRWWTDVTGKQLLEHTRIDNAAAYNENYVYNLMLNHLDGPWWDQVKSRAQLDQIAVPFFSVGNWTSFHFRGNVEGFERAASKDKLFRVHIGGRLTEFYSDEGKTEQLRFYDHWLKGNDTGMMKEPPVRLCVRTNPRECTWRFEDEFPLKRTKYTKFYLTADASGGLVPKSTNDSKLAVAAPTADGALTYDAGPLSASRGARGEPGASFVTDPLAEDTEVTGHVNLVMWISSTTDDADVIARLQKVNADGSIEAVSDGVLKVSHRKLDPKLSRPERPYHSHDVEQKLKPGAAVAVEVEIRTTSMIFQKGSRIRLDILPHDNEQYFAVYHLGKNTVYTGGSRASYLLLPVVPPKAGVQPDLGGIRSAGGAGGSGSGGN
ncbi:MAG: CocE/NonD family hydrolase [Acidobacteriota bacterium]